LLVFILRGTTWFATQLLRHEKNIIWNELMIGHHLYAGGIIRNDRNHRNREEYFFSKQQENHWLPLLKKFILERISIDWKDISKNLIIKEPTASGVSPILMKSFQDSKFIFLLRDGRDIIDSIIDTHRPGSWTGGRTLKNKDERLTAIRNQCKDWNYFSEQNLLAYNNHNHNLRLLLKYEDLLENTLEELKKVYNFLDIPVSNDFLNNQIQKYDFKKIPESQKGPGKFNRAASPGLWKSNFDKEEQDLMNEMLQENLKKFNYI